MIQSFEKSAETGRIRNALIHGETNAVPKPKRNVMSTLGQYRYHMKKMNALKGTKRDVRSIGKNAARERKCGLRTQPVVKTTKLPTANLSPNTEPRMRSTPNAIRFHIRNVTVLKIPIAVMFQDKSVKMFHMKIAVMFKGKDAHKNPGKIVKIYLDKNVRMCTQRFQNK